MDTGPSREIEASTEKLLHDLKAVVRDGEELLRAGARDLTDRGRVAKERLAAALEVARDTQRRLQEQAVAGAKKTDQLIREHPYESIGLAFGAGVLLGIFAGRRS